MKVKKIVIGRTRNWKEAARYPGVRPETECFHIGINDLEKKRGYG